MKEAAWHFASQVPPLSFLFRFRFDLLLISFAKIRFVSITREEGVDVGFDSTWPGTIPVPFSTHVFNALP